MNKNNYIRQLIKKNQSSHSTNYFSSPPIQTDFTEKDCYFVSSRGILKSTNIHSKTPISSINKLMNYSDNKFGLSSIIIDPASPTPTIYVCSAALESFYTLINSIGYKFILITGDSDLTIPTDIPNFMNIINSDKVIHWFAQNSIIDHTKLTRIPIGLDYHTLAGSLNHSWGDKQTPQEQEQILINLKNNSPSFENREIKCYSNFHFSLEGKYCNDRKDAIKELNPDLIYYEPNKILRTQSWQNQVKFAFVVSPHGNGLDCHRTWEALCLGNIPIVKTSKLDPLYEELPVLIVSSWKDITENLLKETIIKFKDQKFNYNKLTLKYWMNRLNNHMLQKKLKIAYCLYGQPRRLLEGYNNITSFLNRHSNISVDFFYHAWFKHLDSNSDQYYDVASYRNISETEKKIDPDIIKKINELYKPMKYNYDEPKIFNDDSQIITQSAVYINSDELIKNNLNNLISQMYSRQQVRDLLLEYLEKNKSIKYDYVITSRFDFIKKIDIDLNNLDSKYVYVSNINLPTKYIPDNFLISSQIVYLNMNNIYKNIEKFINIENNNKIIRYIEKLEMNAEYMLFANYIYYYNDLSNIKYTNLIPNFI
jgi:hypothetical protein